MRVGHHIREYASTPYIGMTQSSPIDSIQGSSPCYFFSPLPIAMKVSPTQYIIILIFPTFQVSTRKTTEIRPFTILAFSSRLFIIIINIIFRKLEHASKCLIRWSPVQCHYDIRAKGIINAIGSLAKPLILPNFAKICTFNFRDYSMFRHTSWYHSVRLIISRPTVTLAWGKRSIFTC